MKDQVQSVRLGKAGRVRGADDTGLDGLLDHFFPIDAASVITDLDHDLVSLMISIERHRTLGRLSGADALFRRFNSMVDSVAYQMSQWFRQHVEDALIEIGVLAAQDERHFFTTRLRYISQDAWKTAKELFHGNHANLHDRFLQIVDDA